MSLFAIVTSPVLRKLEDHDKVAQAWLADDATGTLRTLLGLWKDVIVEGLKYGYFVNQEKSSGRLADCNIDIRNQDRWSKAFRS